MGQTSGAGTGEPRVDEIFADARSMQTQASNALKPATSATPWISLARRPDADRAGEGQALPL